MAGRLVGHLAIDSVGMGKELLLFYVNLTKCLKQEVAILDNNLVPKSVSANLDRRRVISQKIRWNVMRIEEGELMEVQRLSSAQGIQTKPFVAL